ncbi:transposase [Streptomyces puniciscabiei]|uniref:transposase n=1 Tax=Streptomyces puniciscabiei TaxID=164348 RepID=UPI0037886D57
MARGDQTGQQWAVLEPLLPRRKTPGRPLTWARRQLIDGIWFGVRTGVPRRDMPAEYGPAVGCTTCSVDGSGTAPGIGSSPRCRPGRMPRS